MPAISIIIPTFNRSHVLGKAIESIMAQTFQDWELLIVDDGSTDDTRSLVADYQTRCPAIRYLWQENRKQAVARNHGIRVARGRYLAFLDSDDEWMPEKLSRQSALLDRDPRVGMVYGNQWILKDANSPPRWRYAPGTLPSGHVFEALLRREFYCSMQTLLVRRSVVDEVGPLDESLGNSLEDWEFTLRITHRYPVAVIDDPVCLRRVNPVYPRQYTLVRTRNHRAILTKTLATSTVAPVETQRLWRQAFYSGGVSLLQAGYYFRSAGSFIQAAFHGHHLGLPGALLAVAGPAGAALYRKIARNRASESLPPGDSP